MPVYDRPYYRHTASSLKRPLKHRLGTPPYRGDHYRGGYRPPYHPRGGGRGGGYSNRGGYHYSDRGSSSRGGYYRGQRRGPPERGGWTPRGGRGGQQPHLSKEDLDSQLDSYMAQTKGGLDKELDSYMSADKEAEEGGKE